MQLFSCPVLQRVSIGIGLPYSSMFARTSLAASLRIQSVEFSNSLAVAPDVSLTILRRIFVSTWSKENGSI